MPTEANDVYECKICSEVVEVKESGVGTLESCGQPMSLKERYLNIFFTFSSSLI